MTDKKIIAVVGATGQQGGGLARAILDDATGEFALRAITRRPDSDAAKALAARGAEVVSADLDDEASLTEALRGAYGAFFVTAFWEYNSVEREQAQARAMANAAKAAGLAHVIWSTLPDTREHLTDDSVPTLSGNYKVPHFDSKGEAESFFVEAGVPTTNLSTTFYFESFIDFFAPRRGENGELCAPSRNPRSSWATTGRPSRTSRPRSPSTSRSASCAARATRSACSVCSTSNAATWSWPNANTWPPWACCG